MVERHSEFVREADDHYVEPAWTVDLLFDRVILPRGLHDPCCGFGTIPEAASARGIAATGSDLIDRANGRFPIQDFLTDQREQPSVVCNPPFKDSAEFVLHGLRVVRPLGVVAVIAQAKFLFSQGRHALFTLTEFERVIIFSRRPSMPPGKMLAELGEACRGGGAMDYCWCIWRVGKMTPGASIEWTL